jgi:putative transposase
VSGCVSSGAVPALGWRKAHAIAAREGLVVNKKRTHRLWAQEGLKRPARVRKNQRCEPACHQRMKASRPDQMWALDFQVDVTAEGRQVRFLNIIDEYTREALATRAARSFNADTTIDMLDELIATLGRKPEHKRMDNGSMMDWCGYRGVDPAFIDPGRRGRTGSASRSTPLLRRIPCLRTVRHLARGSGLGRRLAPRKDQYRPHGTLGGLTLEALHHEWINNHQPQTA